VSNILICKFKAIRNVDAMHWVMLMKHKSYICVQKFANYW